MAKQDDLKDMHSVSPEVARRSKMCKGGVFRLGCLYKCQSIKYIANLNLACKLPFIILSLSVAGRVWGWEGESRRGQNPREITAPIVLLHAYLQHTCAMRQHTIIYA